MKSGHIFTSMLRTNKIEWVIDGIEQRSDFLLEELDRRNEQRRAQVDNSPRANELDHEIFCLQQVLHRFAELQNIIGLAYPPTR